jgi:hypothetical protein
LSEKYSPVCNYGEREGSPSHDLSAESFPCGKESDANVLAFIGSFLPQAIAKLSSRSDTSAVRIREAEADGKLLNFPVPNLRTESSIPYSMAAINEDFFTGRPAPVKIGDKNYATSYEKNLKEFSDRHPIDRFMAAFNRLMGCFGPRAIYEKLLQVHSDIIAAGHKDKYQGIAAKYSPNRDPFRRIVMAFLLMSFSMQREILSILAE